jgi:glycosyltransferase involved in cell wall biosynthesis
MRVCAVVLTYRALTANRELMLADTVASLKAEADAVYVVDNGSDDDSDRLVRTLYNGLTHGFPLHTSGYGTNLCARVAAGDGADLVMLSDDDMWWRPGWRAALEQWWRFAPEDVALTGGHIEPLFPWNACLGRVEFGEIPGLERTSSGSASWTYRASSFEMIFGPQGIPQQVQGYGDVPACDRVRDRGGRICQLDLAEHRGHGRSTWGNVTIEKYGWDLDPALAILQGAS